DFEDGPPLVEDGDPVGMIVGMNSPEKEKVHFSTHVPTLPKSVEFWMCDLEHMMRQSLLDQTIKVEPARAAYNEDDLLHPRARAAYNEDDRTKWCVPTPHTLNP
ncbi:hypothetical protein T484DRAFT_1865700, partial [Baffinella frigidus]